MDKHMIPDEMHDRLVTIGAEVGPLEAFALAHGVIMENPGPIFRGGESVSQQITRLLGTDDWAILHSGHELVIDIDLDRIEAQEGRVE